MSTMGSLAASARREFGGGFGGEVIGPDDAGYDVARALFNAMIDKRPAVIARCTSAADVASVVGLTTVHIFGFHDPRALPLAEKCGIAFQLTNILRDVREDCGLGRIYLPTEDLRRFGVDATDMHAGRATDAFLQMMEFEAARARDYYDKSRPLLDLVDKRSRSSLWVLITIYSRLLDKIRASHYNVLAKRISLSTWEKLRILATGLLGTGTITGH